MLDLNHIYGSKNSRKDRIVSNFIYNLKNAKEWDPKMFASIFLIIVPMVAASLLGTYLPSWVVKGLEEKWSIGQYVVTIVLLAAAMCVFNMISQVLMSYIRQNQESFTGFYLKKYAERKLDTDYDILEEKRFQEVAGNTHKVAYHGTGVCRVLYSVPTFLIGVLGVIIYGIMIGMKSIWLVLIIMATMLITLKMLSFVRKKHAQYYEKISILARKQTYITRESTDVAAGKDIRIYQMLNWMMKKYEECLKIMDETYGAIHDWYFLSSITGSMAALIRDGFAYVVLLIMLTTGKIQIYEFVLYLGLVTGFATYFEQMIRQTQLFGSMSVNISYVREFFDTKDRWNRKQTMGNEKLDAIKAKPVRLEFRDVSFTYPEKKTPTLKHISFTMTPGEKLALIGLNGAGKMTLVKLICGFYHPTEGEILLNDIPISQFEREEYYSLISVLFQDTTILPVSLDENITGCVPEKVEKDKLKQVLQLSGFWEKYEELPAKGDTMLGREVNKGAVDFSGGEMQKLLFARALYKKAPLIILDEPTAALDPIAENELYLKYKDAMAGRTSLYISHRLSSTRFCDRILLLANGQIVEEGTHDSLLAAGGRYANLFEIQSKYYREQEAKKQMSQAMGDEFIARETVEEGVFHE